MYAFPKLGGYELGMIRFFGSGLGNILFPWARSVIAAKKYNLKQIAPTWPNLRVGSIIRKESDLRFYMDLFRIPEDNIDGIRKLYLLLRSRRISETEFTKQHISNNLPQDSDTIVIFEGLRGYFDDILKDHDMIKQEILNMTLEKHKAGLSYDFGNSLSLHVRLGDFKVGRQTTLMSWFVNIVNIIRRQLDQNIAVNIFSDGDDSELKPLLDLGNARRLSFGSSIADLLALSCSRILVGSKRSTFGMWASYLGRMPAIWPNGGLQQPLYYDKPYMEVQSDGNNDLPYDFLKACKESLK